MHKRPDGIQEDNTLRLMVRQDRKGKFELANGGTLFLDEISASKNLPSDELTLEEMEKKMILESLRRHGNNISVVAAKPGITRQTLLSSLSKLITSIPFFESRFPVGSSARISRGFATTARAIATLCCCPPERSVFLAWRYRLAAFHETQPGGD